MKTLKKYLSHIGSLENIGKKEKQLIKNKKTR